MVGLENYDYGKKRNVRRWFWNRISDKLNLLGKQTKDAIGFYLLGPDNEDGQIALDKGFRRYNLFGIDKNLEFVKKARQEGYLCIHGDIKDVLINWTGPNIDFIYADFLGGLEDNVLAFNDITMTNKIKEDCVLAFNLRRGREKGSFRIMLNECSKTGRLQKMEKFYEKHRGRMLFAYHILDPEGKYGFSLNLNAYIKVICKLVFLKNTNFVIKMAPYKNTLAELMKPSLNSYSSINKNVVYDSIVFISGRPDIADIDDILKLPKLSRQINAVKAWRTMRMNKIK